MSDPLDRLRSALGHVYEIDDVIGAGGHATVYLAHDLKHGRRVALKVLRSELSSAVPAQRFLQEIQIAARLQHPHILPLYDSGEADGYLYYVMPFVEGQALRDRLQEEVQLPVDEAVDIVRQVGKALSYAQRQGVVHRDIKPENIMISDGVAILADFGLARALTIAGGGKLTESGLAVGTPVYMSPEQIKGDRKVDTRSDLYSLGCVLYEMLAGDPPFTGPTAQVVMSRHAVDPVRPLRTARTTVSGSLEAVINRALAKVPADRYQSPDQFIQALTTSEMPALVPTPPLAAPTQRVREESDRDSGERRSFFEEFKRRKVWRTAVLYMVVAIGAFEVVQAGVPALGLPEWVADRAILVILLGFPLALVLSWAYEFTEGRLRRATPSGLAVLHEDLTRTSAHRARRRWTGLCVAGLLVFVVGYPWGYVKTRIGVDLSADVSKELAERFLTDLGGVGFSTVTGLNYTWSSAPLRYYEVTSDLDRAKELALTDPALWQWQHRWFRRGELEDWRVGVGRSGEIVFFEHVIAETAPGATLNQDEALEIAYRFLEGRGWDIGTLDRVEAASQERENRTDHDFAWQDRATRIAWNLDDPEAGSGAVRVAVSVLGDRVERYQREFEVPQDFRRSVLDADEYLENVTATLMVLILLAGVIVTMVRDREAGIRWQQATVFASLASLAFIVFMLNAWPEQKYEQDATLGLPQALFQEAGPALLGLALIWGLLLVLAASAELLIRGSYPSLIKGYNDVIGGRFRSQSVADGCRDGLLLGCLLLGYEALTNALPLWVPNTWGVLSASGPPAADHLLPALTSVMEATFSGMVLGLVMALIWSLLRRYSKHTAVAVMIPAVLIGFGGADPQPVYLGGVVITVQFLILALGFLRFGTLPLIIALYANMLVPDAMNFLRLGTGPNVLNGAFALACVFLPVIPIVLYRQRDQEAPAHAAAR